MRTLVLSDIHANLVALDAVLAAAGQWDRVWFLGDLVGYGPNPNECVERLRDLEPLALSGNHDWAVLNKLDTEEFNDDARRLVNWTRHELTGENLAYLKDLPPLYVAPPFTMAHASPRHPVWEYILDLQSALDNFDHFQTPICLVGHSHIPALFVLDETTAELNFYLVGDAETVDLIGRHQRHFSNFVGTWILIDVRIADKQRTCRQHQVIHRRQRTDALALADHLIDDAEMMAELAGHAANQAIGVTQLQQHGADQRRLAAH